MMRLCHFKVNSAWAFVFGKGDGWTKISVWARTARPLALHGFPLFFETRAEAVKAAESLGLKVSTAGMVETKTEKNPRMKKRVARKIMKRWARQAFGGYRGSTIRRAVACKGRFGSRADAARLKNPGEGRQWIGEWKAGRVSVHVWEERDRLSIVLEHMGHTAAEWWDEDARSMFENGFFKRGRDLERSVVEYAQSMDIKMPGRKHK